MIKVNNLRFTYPTASQPTLKGLNFEIAEREIFGFLGPSGAGKSTTQKIIIGLLKEYDGNISQAARGAGVARRYFKELMDKHGLRQSASEDA